jgi:hypothetical protein
MRRAAAEIYLPSATAGNALGLERIQEFRLFRLQSRCVAEPRLFVLHKIRTLAQLIMLNMLKFNVPRMCAQ